MFPAVSYKSLLRRIIFKINAIIMSSVVIQCIIWYKTESNLIKSIWYVSLNVEAINKAHFC